MRLGCWQTSSLCLLSPQKMVLPRTRALGTNTRNLSQIPTKLPCVLPSLPPFFQALSPRSLPAAHGNRVLTGLVACSYSSHSLLHSATKAICLKWTFDQVTFPLSYFRGSQPLFRQVQTPSCDLWTLVPGVMHPSVCSLLSWASCFIHPYCPSHTVFCLEHTCSLSC